MSKCFFTIVILFCAIGFSSLAHSNSCVYNVGLNCPPSSDPQSFIDGLSVQLNGGAGAGEGCPDVGRIEFDWGDGASDEQWFPATHTYATTGDYTITVSAFDVPSEGSLIAANDCQISIECQTDSDCDDGQFCNGTEMCMEGTCGAVSACPPAIDGCVIKNYSCDEVNDQCVDFLDDAYCAEHEACILSGDCVPLYVCDGFHSPFDVPMAVKKKSKRALPLKFNLYDGYGAEITSLSPPPIVEVRVSGDTGSDIAGYDGELLPAGLSDDGNQFYYNLESGQWELNLGMKAYTASTTYTITVVSGDSSYQIDGCTQSFTRQN